MLQKPTTIHVSYLSLFGASFSHCSPNRNCSGLEQIRYVSEEDFVVEAKRTIGSRVG